MKNIFLSIYSLCGILLLCSTALQAQSSELSAEESAAAAANYQKYCALCHGEDRQGYANDAAPSLRSESLIRSGYPLHLAFAIGYGRHGTPMGGYFEEIGGPLSNRDIFQLVNWLKDQVPVEPVEMGFDPVIGDAATGAEIYADQCSVCHGENGEGELGPAIGNPAMLAITTDSFIRYAIEHGRDGTDMPAFNEILTDAEIDSVTAFLRSKATGWDLERPVMRTPPSVEEYVVNPDGSPPQFDLQDGMYVKSKDLHQALQDKQKMVLIDTRVTSMWQMGHIAGSVPMPYYYNDVEILAKDLPNDSTWIVAYCECPRAAAETVTRKLRRNGFQNTAVLWEGFQGWVAMGFPISVGQSTVAPKLAVPELVQPEKSD